MLAPLPACCGSLLDGGFRRTVSRDDIGPRVARRAQRRDDADILLRAVVTDDDSRASCRPPICANGVKSAVRTGKTISSQV